MLLKRPQNFVHRCISQETKIPTAGLYILGLGLEFAAKLVKIDLLGAENKSVPGLFLVGQSGKLD